MHHPPVLIIIDVVFIAYIVVVGVLLWNWAIRDLEGKQKEG